MGWLDGVEWVFAVVVVLAVLIAVSLFVRRRALSSRGGIFDCGMRLWKSGQPTSWTMGMARYSGEIFQWYRAFSLLPAPSAQLRREDIRVAGQRKVDDLEAMSLFNDHWVIDLEPEADSPRRELSMTRESLTGLLSWLEAAPPGGPSYRARV
ncbi:MAG: DUF2550 domain-containing protein [Actinomycetia bacterium]|nr:DUF2550 domain-containing protein [Actinomycetes bacterium]